MSAQHRADPGHSITITRASRPLRVIWNGRTIAQSDRVLDLKEASYPVVHYVPRADADMALFEKTPRSTHCPFKGDASYFTLRDGATAADNAVWSYETPLSAVAQIAGHLAFYPDKVTFEDV